MYHSFLLKSIVFTVCEHEYMNIDPLSYRAGYAAARNGRTLFAAIANTE